MGEVMEKRAESERQAVELDDFDIAIGSGPNAILALRRKGGNQVETFQIATERLRTACRVLHDMEAVEELREVRKQLSEIAKNVPMSKEIALHLFDMLEARYDFPIRERE